MKARKQKRKPVILAVEEVRRRVELLRETAGDSEVAHAIEDEIHVTVLRAVAAGGTNSVELALEALKTLEIQFNRWCG